MHPSGMDPMGAPALQLVKMAGVVRCLVVLHAPLVRTHTVRSRMGGAGPLTDTITCRLPKLMTTALEDHQLVHQHYTQLQHQFPLRLQHVPQDREAQTDAVARSSIKGVQNTCLTAMRTMDIVVAALRTETPKQARLMITRITVMV